MPHNSANYPHKPMLPVTRKLLHEFYKPFNRLLADYMGDRRYDYALNETIERTFIPISKPRNKSKSKPTVPNRKNGSPSAGKTKAVTAKNV